jgi:hypothetical protein
MQDEGYCACGCGEKTWVATKTWARHGWVKGRPVRFVRGHHSRPATPEYIVDQNGCWIWQRALRNGYGVAREPAGGQGPAHRIFYERFVGPIPEGLQLDHICRTPACVNPEHLEPVTLQENVRRGLAPSAVNARKRFCIRGHELTEDNIYRPPREPHKRACRECIRIRSLARSAHENRPRQEQTHE